MKLKTQGNFISFEQVGPGYREAVLAHLFESGQYKAWLTIPVPNNGKKVKGALKVLFPEYEIK